MIKGGENSFGIAESEPSQGGNENPSPIHAQRIALWNKAQFCMIRSGFVATQGAAPCFNNSRAMIIRWIWLVPS